MQYVSNDVLERVSTYLLANELGRFGVTCTHLHTLVYNSGAFSALLWRQLLARASLGENKLHHLHVNSIIAHARRDLLKGDDGDGGDNEGTNAVDEVKCMSETARRLQAIASLDTFCWRTPAGVTRLPKMEGHAATLIAGGCVWAIVSGWDMNADNSLILLDVSQVPELRLIPCVLQNNPVFRYGFSAVTLTEVSRRQLNACTAWYTGRGDCKAQKEGFSTHNDNDIKGDSVIVYGGCRGGGYTADCSNLYEIVVQMPEDNPDGVGAIATYRQLHTVGTCLTRGYHSANLVVVDGDPCLMVFGGFHRQAATNSLEMLHLPSLSWIPIGHRTFGTPPCERFGHSITPLKEFSGLVANLHAEQNSKLERVRSDGTDDTPRKQLSPSISRSSSTCSSSSCSVLSLSSTKGNRYILIGGSDGSDLIRDGRELSHVYILDLKRDSSGDTFHWSCPSIYFTEGTSHREIVGRCHSAAVIGSKIILYGGGARCNNTQIYVLDTEPTVLPTFPHPVTGDDEAQQQDDDENPNPYNSFIQENEDGIVSTDAFVYYRATVKKIGTSSAPLPRISAVTVIAGGYLLVFGGFSRGSLGDIWLLDLSFRNSDDFHSLRRAISTGQVDEEDTVIKQMGYIGLDRNSGRAEILNFLQSMGAMGGEAVEEETLAMLMGFLQGGMEFEEQYDQWDEDSEEEDDDDDDYVDDENNDSSNDENNDDGDDNSDDGDGSNNNDTNAM